MEALVQGVSATRFGRPADGLKSWEARQRGASALAHVVKDNRKSSKTVCESEDESVSGLEDKGVVALGTAVQDRSQSLWRC